MHHPELYERDARVAEVRIAVDAARSDDIVLHSAIFAGQRKRMDAHIGIDGVLIHMSCG